MLQEIENAVVKNSAARVVSSSVNDESDAELRAWLERYEPVEQEIMLACERRRENRAQRREKKARAFGDLCEATGGFAVVWRREGWSVADMLAWAGGDALTLNALARWLGKDASKLVNREQCRLRRPLYYAKEKERRAILAEERRRLSCRRTSNPCPIKEEVLDAWIKRRESHEAALRFGSMIHDLECYVDNSLLRNEAGAIVGRRGGIKTWLKNNIPALHLRYTTVMRYKAMAKKFKQVAELPDPTPAAAIITEQRATPELKVVKARAIWQEIVKDLRPSATALIDRIDALTDPERIDDANMLAEWKAKYENEITVRMKSRWWRRLLKWRPERSGKRKKTC